MTDQNGTDQNGDNFDKYIQIWSKAVDTQMHFNEMSVKSRQLGLTFVAAALGIAVVLMSRGKDFALAIPKNEPIFQIHVSVIITLGALLALYAVRTLDINVYHQMLRGAVTFGEDFEQNYMKQIFYLNKGMTQAISHYSRYADKQRKEIGQDGKYKYIGEHERTAEDKIKNFYFYAFIFLGGAAVAIFVLTNLNIWIDFSN